MENDTHFEVSAWAEFVRNADDRPERAAMQEHLSSCSQCRRIVSVMRRFAPVVSHRGQKLPQAAVRYGAAARHNGRV